MAGHFHSPAARAAGQAPCCPGHACCQRSESTYGTGTSGEARSEAKFRLQTRWERSGRGCRFVGVQDGASQLCDTLWAWQAAPRW